MGVELAHLCGFVNPNKCTNYGAKALGVIILQNAPNHILKNKRLHHQGHKGDSNGCPYFRDNDMAGKRLQDSLTGNFIPQLTTNPTINVDSSALNPKPNHLLQTDPSLQYPALPIQKIPRPLAQTNRYPPSTENNLSMIFCLRSKFWPKTRSHSNVRLLNLLEIILSMWEKREMRLTC